MYIIGITACTAGIAHTYIAKEKLENAAKENGHTIKIETQGTIGVENELTKEDVEKADVVILAHDIVLNGLDRFKGKPVVDVPISLVMKNAKALIVKIEKTINK